jgi:hypothetical protein
MSSHSPRLRDITINTTGAPTAGALADILGAHHRPGMMLFHDLSSLATQITFLERNADGERRVSLRVTHAEAVYDGGYRDRSIDDGGVHKAEGDSNRPEVKRLLERLGCPEKLPKIQVSKETIEVSEEEEDEDNSSTTRKKSATRSSFTWATEKNGVTTTVIVKAQTNGVRLYVSTDYRAARAAFLVDVAAWAASRSPEVCLFPGQISIG